MKRTQVVGVDPGINGAFVLTDGQKVSTWTMPIAITGKDKTILFAGVYEVLAGIERRDGKPHVFLERAIPFAMASKSAFSYGRGFETILIALELLKFPVTLVDPGKWAKEMHEGISTDLKPKIKSGIAAQRLFPQLVAQLPKKPKGGTHDGFIDALLIAGYGLRRLGPKPARSAPVEHFF